MVDQTMLVSYVFGVGRGRGGLSSAGEALGVSAAVSHDVAPIAGPRYSQPLTVCAAGCLYGLGQHRGGKVVTGHNSVPPQAMRPSGVSSLMLLF